MEVIRVLAAALAAYVFSAVWYTGLARHWLPVSGIALDGQGRPLRSGGAAPFIVGAVAYVLVAGMMRHVFTMSGIASPGFGLLAGFGIGAFFITPWVAMNYAFAQRPVKLMAIDGANSVVGCSLIGLVLVLL